MGPATAAMAAMASLLAAPPLSVSTSASTARRATSPARWYSWRLTAARRSLSAVPRGPCCGR
eukprot:6457940-Lingulodinium_polyedra.AAC.1